MPDSRRFLHPEAIKRITRLELRARHIVEGFLSGMHRSPFFGQSIEFRQHREYVPGDDLRHVDWQVWGRQDRLYVKQYEEDTNLRLTILLDCSGSMAYGGGVFTKFDYARTLAASLSWLVLRQQDAVGAITFDSSIRTVVPHSNARGQLESLCRNFDATTSGDTSDFDKVFTAITPSIPQKGMVLLLSDLFGEPSGILRALSQMKSSGHDVNLLHVMDDDELDFDFSGPTRFEGMESDAHLNCNPAALRDGYLEAVDQFLQTVRHGTARIGIPYKLVRTSQAFDTVLAEFLSERMSHQR
ncbi:MAG: DUF58 domain-containing protein [Pirellulaceae bacterium]